MPLQQHTWPPHPTSWLPRAPGQARHHSMTDGDVAEAAIHGPLGAFRFRTIIADLAGSAPPGRPVEGSLEAVLSVPLRHDATVAGG